MAYTVAAQLTAGDKSKYYSDVVADIVAYLARDLTHPGGGFFSAEDADSWAEAERGATTSAGAPGHKKEGAFCVWTAAEIRTVLDNERIEGTSYSLADLVMQRYHVRERGNVDPRGDPHGELRGQNVLTELPLEGGGTSDEGGMLLLADQPELYAKALARAKEMLFERRLQRPRPDRDDKVGEFVGYVLNTGTYGSGTGIILVDKEYRYITVNIF
jgi:uncharacterized protein YyaL (SSP411 family)